MSEQSGNAKRRRFHGPKSSKPSKTTSIAATCNIIATNSEISVLPDAVLQHCFSFIGPGHYRYVAGTSHRFQEIYSKEHEKQTWFWNAATSVECAKLSLDEKPVFPGLADGDTFSPSDAIVLAASWMGNVEVLEWFRIKGFDYLHHLAFEDSALRGHTRVLKWAESKNMDWYSVGLHTNAGASGHVEIFEWIHSTGKAAHVPEEAGIYAAENGHIAILRWLKEHQMLDSAENLWHYAGRGGRTEVLDWLGENGYEFRPDLIYGGACSGGQKSVLFWGRDHDMAWDEATCSYAAQYGNLPILQWLRENGCPWDGRVIRFARQQGFDDILEWARANGCPTEEL